LLRNQLVVMRGVAVHHLQALCAIQKTIDLVFPHAADHWPGSCAFQLVDAGLSI